MCSQVSCLIFLLCLNMHESSFKALMNVFEGSDFLSYYEQNKIAHSEISQQNKSISGSKVTLTSSDTPQFRNKSNVIRSTESSIFMVPREQIMMTTKSLNRKRLFQNKSQTLLVSHRKIQRMIRQYKIR